MDRNRSLSRIRQQTDPFDFVVVGCGATGAGIAVDAAARGYSVVVLDQSDVGKGTSSRSTKLVHGGVRYLQQGNIPLVMEALKERGILRQNAPHLVRDLPFVVPNYSWWEAPFYGVGMKVYDALAGRYGFGRSHVLDVEETLERIPTIETEGLKGGVVYHDGQFDDARLLVNLIQTASEQGAEVVNYLAVTGLLKDDDDGDREGFVVGVVAEDRETGDEVQIRARVVVNATGVFTDSVRRMDDPAAAPVIQPSQGVHVVLPRRFLPRDNAIMVPHTDDGRVLFAIPWYDTVVVGTTDTPVDEPVLEPRPLEEEVAFILKHCARYLDEDPGREDVLSIFAGLRPLVSADPTGETSSISREHAILVSNSGLVTIAGGKWTTYRKMAEDVVDHAAIVGGMESRECPTKVLNIHGYHMNADRFGPLSFYGSDAPEVEALAVRGPKLGRSLHPELPLLGAQVVWAVQEEMARTVDDVLARRTRCLLFNARASIEAAPKVAEIMARELGRDESWVTDQVAEFAAIAEGYVLH